MEECPETQRPHDRRRDEICKGTYSGQFTVVGKQAGGVG